MSEIERILDEAFPEKNDPRMNRLRPYTGQAHTNDGWRGAQMVDGLTHRDLRDCLVRAFFLCSHDQLPSHYDQAKRGEEALLSENDLYLLDYNKIDPVALIQNFGCEVERMMGVFPLLPPEYLAARAARRAELDREAPPPSQGEGRE